MQLLPLLLCLHARATVSMAPRAKWVEGLASRVILAPLERVSDVGFRKLCFEQGAGFTWTEMVYCSDLKRASPSAVQCIDTFDSDTPTGLQLLVDRTSAPQGYGVGGLRAALDQLELLASTSHPHWRNIAAIDLNFGCPSPGIVKPGPASPFVATS